MKGTGNLLKTLIPQANIRGMCVTCKKKYQKKKQSFQPFKSALILFYFCKHRSQGQIDASLPRWTKRANISVFSSKTYGKCCRSH